MSIYPIWLTRLVRDIAEAVEQTRLAPAAPSRDAAGLAEYVPRARVALFCDDLAAPSRAPKRHRR